MTERIDRLRERLAKEGVDALVIDSPYNRRYLTGFTGSAGAVVVGRNAVHLITDFRYFDQVRAQAPTVELVESESILGGLARLLDEQRLYERVAFEAEHVSVKVQRERQERLAGCEWAPTVGWVEEVRIVKDAGEVAAIRRAVHVADQAFTYIVDRLKGRSERAIALDLEFFMRKEGAERLAFASIVASGPHGALPHAAPSDRVVGTGDLVTLDFGCVVDGYCSDMTRTVAVGKADAKQRDVYELVLAAQEAGVKAVRAGRTGQEVDAEARRVIDDGGYGDRFGHGLGHGVGLEIHEEPRLKKASETVLELGMVTSVEPGIYISDWGGVRIEDLVLVTEDGCLVLTQSPKGLIEV